MVALRVVAQVKSRGKRPNSRGEVVQVITFVPLEIAWLDREAEGPEVVPIMTPVEAETKASA